MPILLLIPLIASVGALAFKTVAGETRATAQELTRNTGPNIVLIGAAALGLYAAYRMIDRGKL